MLYSAIFSNIIPSCSIVGALEEGMDIHQRVFENIFSFNVVVVSALIDMYTNYRRIQKALELFKKNTTSHLMLGLKK